MYKHPIRSDELMHYGVKGMHWGVRRYQNYDGTLIHPKGRYNEKNVDMDFNDDKTVGQTRPKAVTKPDYNRRADVAKIIAKTAAMGVGFIDLSLPNDVRRLVSKNRSLKALKKEERSLKKNKNIDPKTGFRLKTELGTPEDDLKHINPGFNQFTKDTAVNCMLCTTTMEMRRRGFDVTANFSSNFADTKNVKHWFPDVKIKGALNRWGIDKDNPTKEDRQRVADNLNKMHKERMESKDGLNSAVRRDFKEISKLPNGSRGNLMVIFGPGWGHSMFFTVEKGKVKIYDGQVNKVYNDPMEILKRVDAMQYARLDNCNIDYEAIKEACR